VTLTNEGVKQVFAEQVGREISDEVAKSIVENVASVIDDLNAIDAEPLFLVEPNIVFDPTYPGWEDRGRWPSHPNSSASQSLK
jgi:hypothetical protein